jgi:hypothetical protein
MKKAALMAVVFILIAGCIFFQPENKYELFSNIPSEGATSAVFVDLKEDTFGEMSSMLGTILGGTKLKDLKGAQFALLSYENGGSAGVLQVKTNLELNELLEGLPSGYEDLVNETKQIDGKEVVLLYQKYDNKKENPVCMWREGEWLKFLYYQKGYTYAVDGNILNEPFSNDSTRCDNILEKKYDTEKAGELLASSAEMKNKFSAAGTFFGEGMAYIENSSAYISLFGDGNGDYAVAMLQGKKAGNNLCYNDSSSGGRAEVVIRDNKEACLKEMKQSSSSSYPIPMSMSFIYIERRVGNYSLMVFAYVKEKKDAVINNAEDIIFSIDFPGEETRWTDKMTLTVDVYETEGSSLQRIPVADANVSLYKYGYPIYDYEYSPDGVAPTRAPIRSAKTNDNGVVKFTDLEIGSYSVEATKDGYSKGTDYVYAGDTNSSIRLQKLEPLRVNVREGSYSSGIPVAEAKVVLYNESSIFADGGAGGYTQSYEVIDTKYTNASGVADFGKINVDNGEVEVSKEGYYNSTGYVSSYSRNVTVYLTPSKKGALKVYVDEVAAGDPFPNYPTVAGAKIELYNKSGGGYALLKTLYTDSSGIADFGYIDIDEGKIEASKEGYYKSTGIIRSGMVTFVTTFTVRLVKVVGNASADYPIIQAAGSGCMTPSKDQAPPEWVIGSPDGKRACFWETRPIVGRFDKTITVSKFNLTVAANSVSVNRPLEVLISNDANCYYDALEENFTSYTHYATFTPDVASELKEYVVSNGTVNARCIAVKDMTNDVNGYYIDAIGVK